MTSFFRSNLLAAAGLAALALGVSQAAAEDAAPSAQRASAEAAGSLASPKYGAWGFDASGIDPSVKPGDDFFKWANGKWDERTTIPSDRVRFGNFDALSVLSENR